ncbi:MAG: SCO6745 family protein [Actinomycetota bacterium]
MTDWLSLTRRASFASHQLIGWIFWDPTAKANLEALGVPGGIGHYIVNRGAPLCPAGPEALFAAFYTIHRDFVHGAWNHTARHTTDWHAVSRARDNAVLAGLERMTPGVIGPLGELADALWNVVDTIPSSGRVLFAAHKSWPRPDNPALGAWNALNALREWRGDTHFGILVSEDIGVVEAGLLHDAWMGYPKEWIPRSRGANDDQIAAAVTALERRGWATDGVVNTAGIEFRQWLEEETNRLCARCWETFGAENTETFLALIEPVGHRFVEHIDATAGPNWMPAARPRRV